MFKKLFCSVREIIEIAFRGKQIAIRTTNRTSKELDLHYRQIRYENLLLSPCFFDGIPSGAIPLICEHKINLNGTLAMDNVGHEFVTRSIGEVIIYCPMYPDQSSLFTTLCVLSEVHNFTGPLPKLFVKPRITLFISVLFLELPIDSRYVV
jgi:hypothetical protein